MQSICVVEDESSILEMVKMNLELEGYLVTCFSNGRAAMESLRENHNYDLLILDVMLPEKSGVEICIDVRSYSSIPILFLSAKGTTSDRIEGLKAGGNDYLPKPFDLEELLLRTAILTQNNKSVTEHLTIGNLEVSFKTFEVVDGNKQVISTLSKKEVELIRLFSQKEGEVVSRDEILDRVWGADNYPTSRTIDNFILNLRKLFEENPKDPKYFHSIRGVGYKFTR